MTPRKSRLQNYRKPIASNRNIPASPLAVVCLAFFFSSSGLALVVEEVFANPLFNISILIAGPASLWVTKTKLRRKVFSTKEYRQVQNGLLFVGCLACLSATAAVFDTALSAAAIRACLLKTGGLIFMFIMMATCASAFTMREVIYSLIVFALVEFSTMASAFFVFGIDLNPNAVGVRVATSGLVLFAVLPRAVLRALAWIGSLAVAFMLQCRTSMVASIGAVVAGYFEARTRMARGSLIVLAVIACSTLLVLGEDITGALRKTATSNLQSTNPIAKFFLSDKDRGDVSGDFLDRRHVWTAMIRRFEDRPLLGYGVGTESALFRTRSHNAYLSLLIEGGVGLLASWIFVYGIFVARMLNRVWIERFAKGPIGKTQVLLFAYLALAGLFESSGIGSISTPNNIIFLFLLLWVSLRLTIPVLRDCDSPRLTDTSRG